MQGDIQSASSHRSQHRRKLQKVLEARKTELICHLQQTTQDKLKNLAVQRDQIEITQVQLINCLDLIKENLGSSKQAQVLMMKDTIVKQVKDLSTTFREEILAPNMEYSPLQPTSQQFARTTGKF